MPTGLTVPAAFSLLGSLHLPWWLAVALVAYWVVVVVLLINDNREPQSTLTWLLVLIFLPVIGLLLFLFFGRDWKVITARRHWAEGYWAAVIAKMRPVYERNATARRRFTTRYGETAALGIARAIEKENQTQPLPATTLEIFATGAEKFARLAQDLSTARRFIHLEYFIWEKDELTADITQILLDRLAAGVEVRIMYDYVGSISFKKDELKQLAAAGAKVSADVTSAMKLNYRNHRKIAVIDGEIGYTGGMNMGKEYIDGGLRFETWRDTHLRMTGQAVAELQKLFAMRWFEDEHEDLLTDAYLPAPDGAATDGDQAAAGGDEAAAGGDEAAAGGDEAAAGDDATGVLTQVVAHTIEDPWDAGRRAHMMAISGARRTLRIQSPYFVPDQATYDALVNAALSGADVRFMMTGKIDKKLPYWAAHTYYEPLLRAGAHIYQYEAGFFHAKTIAVDSLFGAVGTMNMDIRSMRLHKELMVWIYDEAYARELEEIFDRDLAQCREVTLEDVRSLPRLIRFRNSFARLFSAEI